LRHEPRPRLIGGGGQIARSGTQSEAQDGDFSLHHANLTAQSKEG
jgi:hypothetical protein